MTAMFKRFFATQASRRRVSWAIAIFLILPVVLSVAFYGPFPLSGRGSSSTPGGTAGKLFGKAISAEDFDNQRRWTRIQLQARLAGAPDAMLDPLINQYTWERLMLVEEAKRRGLKVDDLELAGTIQRLPEFHQDGQFRRELYHTFLRNAGLPAPTFERLLRNDLLVDKLLAQVREGVVVTDEDVRQAFARAHEELAASMLLVESSSKLPEAAAAITDQEVRARYDELPDEFERPAQVTFDYAGVARESLSGAIQPTDEEIKAYYDAHPEDFLSGDSTTPKPFDEVRDAAHQAVVRERVTKQLTERALDLEEDLEATFSFDEIVAVRELTKQTAGPIAVDEAPAPGGPELGILQSVRDLEEGRMSGVIRTANGVYLARVTERIPPVMPPFEEIRGDIRADLIQKRAALLARQQAETWRAVLEKRVAEGLRFEEAALAEGLSPKPVRFARGQSIDPIGYERGVNAAAFEAPLGSMTSVLDTVRGAVVLRPEELISPDFSTLAQEEAALREETLNRLRDERFGEWLDDVRTRAKLESFVDPAPPGA
jgi:peptidyl-prolyl cis-trans isomerase D